MKKSILKDKSYDFALAIVALSRKLQVEDKAYVLGNQILRSGTAIGSMVREAEFAQSRADFVNKMSVALKEVNETSYWIELLLVAELITTEQHTRYQANCKELLAMLVATVKTAKAGGKTKAKAESN